MLLFNLFIFVVLCLIFYVFILYFICNNKKNKWKFWVFYNIYNVDIFLLIFVEFDWLVLIYREFNFFCVKILVLIRMWIINIIFVFLRGYIYIIVLVEYW